MPLNGQNGVLNQFYSKWVLSLQNTGYALILGNLFGLRHLQRCLRKFSFRDKIS